MLSVNIPVYNIIAGPLVKELVRQANLLDSPVEIRVFDDGSEASIKQANRKLSELPGVIYREMPKNLGRAAIRNKMGLESTYPWLLFIDADSRVISPTYIHDYLIQLNSGRVICGGTAYHPLPPEEPQKMLRWVYGSRREAITAEKRTRQKGFIITSNNFLIDKTLFEKVHFRENLGPYGHEDTLLGYDLFKAGITPLHIQNPVEHTGLEDAATFLRKTRNALENLRLIALNMRENDETFNHQVQFLKFYQIITHWIPGVFLRTLFRLFKKKIEKNLTEKKPRLLWFDLYKLGFFSELNFKQKQENERNPKRAPQP